jgi:hypothetical protein
MGDVAFVDRALIHFPIWTSHFLAMALARWAESGKTVSSLSWLPFFGCSPGSMGVVVV